MARPGHSFFGVDYQPALRRAGLQGGGGVRAAATSCAVARGSVLASLRLRLLGLLSRLAPLEGSPETDLLEVEPRRGKLGVHLRADMAPAQVLAPLVELVDALDDAVPAPGLVAPDLVIIETGELHGQAPGAKISRGSAKQRYLLLGHRCIIEILAGF